MVRFTHLTASSTPMLTFGGRRIQPAVREPRRRPNGDILHAQCDDLPKIQMSQTLRTAQGKTRWTAVALVQQPSTCDLTSAHAARDDKSVIPRHMDISKASHRNDASSNATNRSYTRKLFVIPNSLTHVESVYIHMHVYIYT